jgi:coenzyme F420 hydrogenase subunit beta
MIPKTIERIVGGGLCLGCGLCESLSPELKMTESQDGFFVPTGDLSRKDSVIPSICPGVNVEDDVSDSEDGVWGKVLSCLEASSSDDEVRFTGSSGGVISQVAIYLLEQGIVEGVLQVGASSDDYKSNRLKISRSKEDVLSCASSRYAPALIFDNIIQLLEGSQERYAFIGKPCDISALKNLLNYREDLRSRFVIMVSIFCAGIPSFKGTEKVIRSFDVDGPVESLQYRGNGWPGEFKIKDSKGNSHSMTYGESWGEILGKHVHFRCKLCPDGIGLQADLAVGDSWETKDGYPDFSEKAGRSLVIVRSNQGQDLLNKMSVEGALDVQSLEVDRLSKIQPSQFSRRRTVWWRILAFSIKKRVLLNFRKTKVFKNSFQVSFKHRIAQFIGMWKRMP